VLLATDFEANMENLPYLDTFLAIFSGFQTFEFQKSEAGLEGYGFRNLANLYLGT
jgi:hypothetical protein